MPNLQSFSVNQLALEPTETPSISQYFNNDFNPKSDPLWKIVVNDNIHLAPILDFEAPTMRKSKPNVQTYMNDRFNKQVNTLHRELDCRLGENFHNFDKFDSLMEKVK